MDGWGLNEYSFTFAANLLFTLPIKQYNENFWVGVFHLIWTCFLRYACRLVSKKIFALSPALNLRQASFGHSNLNNLCTE